jgi:hypothetical protein
MSKLKNRTPPEQSLIFSGHSALKWNCILWVAVLLWTGAARGEVSKPVEHKPDAVKQSDPWRFNVALYGWAPSINAGLTTGGDLDISLEDILDNLDGTLMFAGGVRKGKWALYSDLLYLNLEADNSLGRINADSELTVWISHISGSYTMIQNDDFSLDVLAGARYLYLDIDLDLDIERKRKGDLPIDIEKSGNAWNAIAGIRGHIELPKNWYSTYYFDAGTGDSHFTWQAMGGVGYEFEKFDVFAGYRYLKWNFHKDDDFGKVLKDLEIKGPYMGVKLFF